MATARTAASFASSSSGRSLISEFHISAGVGPDGRADAEVFAYDQLREDLKGVSRGKPRPPHIIAGRIGLDNKGYRGHQVWPESGCFPRILIVFWVR